MKEVCSEASTYVDVQWKKQKKKNKTKKAKYTRKQN